MSKALDGIRYFARFLNSLPSTERNRPGLLDSSSSAHFCKSASVLAAGNSRSEHSTVLTGIRMPLSDGTSQFLSTTPPPPASQKENERLPCPSPQFCPVLSRPGFVSDGIESSQSHHLMVQSSYDFPYGLESTANAPC